MSLRRIRAGAYETRDGRFSLVRAPLAPEAESLSRWWVYDNEGNAEALNANDPCKTLREARAWLGICVEPDTNHAQDSGSPRK